MTYFYILTLQWLLGPGDIQTQTVSGTVQGWKGRTRLDAFNTILATTRESLVPAPDAAAAVVLFFSLEPNVLTASGKPATAGDAGAAALPAGGAQWQS